MVRLTTCIEVDAPEELLTLLSAAKTDEQKAPFAVGDVTVDASEGDLYRLDNLLSLFRKAKHGTDPGA